MFRTLYEKVLLSIGGGDFSVWFSHLPRVGDCYYYAGDVPLMTIDETPIANGTKITIEYVFHHINTYHCSMDKYGDDYHIILLMPQLTRKVLMDKFVYEGNMSKKDKFIYELSGRVRKPDPLSKRIINHVKKIFKW